MTQTKKNGFTIIELMLAMAFVSFVLLFVVTTIIQVLRTYNKGLVIKEINQTARTVSEDMGRVIRNSSKLSAITSAQNDGRLCFGGVSYVWNLAGGDTNKYSDGSKVNFARVNDPGSSLCSNSSGIYPNVEVSRATPLVSDRVWVHQIQLDVTSYSVADLKITLSTADDPSNPALTPDPIQGVVCKGGKEGDFCAVATFNAILSLRRS